MGKVTRKRYGAEFKAKVCLIKLAVRVVELKTQVKLHLPSHAPCQSILALVLGRMPRLIS
jgi:hypothetical protein